MNIADGGQGRGVDRKHIHVLGRAILFLLFPIKEEEATDRDWGC